MGRGEQAAEGVSVRPVEWQPEGDAAGSPGDPGGHGDQVAAQDAGTGPGMEQANQATSGAGEVMGGMTSSHLVDAPRTWLDGP
ncbi:MAG: hypothetical protein LC776_11120 [Acidobacteria bacterium]|nr:hypothetical protein [Acidobacteriota bacterium]